VTLKLSVESHLHSQKKEAGYLEKISWQALEDEAGERGGSVTPEEVTGRYVSLERYVPEEDRHR